MHITIAMGEQPSTSNSKALADNLQVLLGNCSSRMLRRNDVFDVRCALKISSSKDAADFHNRRNFIRQQYMRKLQRRGINQSRKKRQARQLYESEQKRR